MRCFASREVILYLTPHVWPYKRWVSMDHCDSRGSQRYPIHHFDLGLRIYQHCFYHPSRHQMAHTGAGRWSNADSTGIVTSFVVGSGMFG